MTEQPDTTDTSTKDTSNKDTSDSSDTNKKPGTLTLTDLILMGLANIVGAGIFNNSTRCQVRDLTKHNNC
jgi:hypothetical protein